MRKVENVDKAEWLKAIGAKRYVEESDLKELKAQYEKNKAHALEVIKAKKELDTHC